MRLVRLCRLFTLLYARDFVFFLAERKDKQKIKTLFRTAQSGESLQSLTSLTPYQKGQGQMRQIDVICRAVAETFDGRMTESELRRSVLAVDGSKGVRRWLLRNLPDVEAQEQLAELRQPAMRQQMFNSIMAGIVAVNQAKAKGVRR